MERISASIDLSFVKMDPSRRTEMLVDIVIELVKIGTDRRPYSELEVKAGLTLA